MENRKASFQKKLQIELTNELTIALVGISTRIFKTGSLRDV
jgi:hypothetical protein